MAHKSKHDRFHLSFAVIIRLAIFSMVVAMSIIYFSTRSNPALVLGDSIEVKPVIDNIYNAIPPQSRKKIEELPSSPMFGEIQSKIKVLQNETNGFPQKQVNDIKKAVVQQIYENVMKSIK